MTTVCFYLYFSDELPRRRVCLKIPELVLKWPPLIPEPDPWVNLQILATIDELAARLQSDVGKDLQNIAREGLRNAAADSFGGEVTFAEREESSTE